MTKFKIGDEVRIIKPHAHSSNFLNTTFIITSRNSDWDGEQSWYGARHPYRYKESQLELANPPKSTGFEVGKQYVFCGEEEYKEYPEVIYTIEHHMSNGRWAYTTNKGNVGFHSDKDFKVFKEYISPPPEEWRIVYKDRFGNVTVGKVPFKSESEAKASRYWTDHKSSAFKTIRVDA